MNLPKYLEIRNMSGPDIWIYNSRLDFCGKHQLHIEIQFLDIICYRYWPRYGLRWSGLCCHSRRSASGAGRRAAACGRLHECCAGSGSTNHDSADRMSGQFLFHHENEAIHNDKSRDDHDDEPPCWNALADNVIVMMEASIDTVSE